MKKRIAFALACLCLLVSALEIGARLFGPGLMPANPKVNDNRHMPADSLVGWRAQPGAQQDFGVPRPTYVNQHGIRGPETPLQKSEDELRILLLGDSTVYGVRVSDEETFGGTLEQSLMPHRINARVLNAGCPGYSSWQALQILQHRLLDLKPDIVVIATLWSDAQGSESPDSARYGNGETRGWLTHSAFYVWAREQLRKRRWQSQDSETIGFRFNTPGPSMPGGPPPPPENTLGPNKLAPTHRVPLRQYRDNLASMARLSEEAGAQPVFLILPSFRDVLLGRVGDFRDAYRESMKTVAQDFQAPLINSSEEFFGGDVNALFFDDVHPTARGHKIIADALLSTLIQLKKP